MSNPILAIAYIKLNGVIATIKLFTSTSQTIESLYTWVDYCLQDDLGAELIRIELTQTIDDEYPSTEELMEFWEQSRLTDKMKFEGATEEM